MCESWRLTSLCLASKSLRSSLTYPPCQSNLLLEKIRQKKSTMSDLGKDFKNLHSPL